MKILLLLFVLAFIGLYVVLGAVRHIGRMLMGDPEPPRGKQQQPPRRKSQKSGIDTSGTKPRKKVIAKDEGEYIDYEEVHDK